MIKIASLTFNPFGENTYVLSAQSGEAIVVDAGCHSAAECEHLETYLTKHSLRPILALNTHGHIDHACGVDWLTKKYNVPFAIHPQERAVLGSMKSYGEALGFRVESAPTIDRELKDGDKIELGDQAIQVIHTPGHTAGGVCLWIESQKMLLTGDTLFCQSIGRTDLPGGDYRELMRSIVERILPLGDDVKIFPGHGSTSDLMSEKRRNPFITEVLEGRVSYEN